MRGGVTEEGGSPGGIHGTHGVVRAVGKFTFDSSLHGGTGIECNADR